MTEAEWLSCSDPQPMLDFLQGRGVSGRKLRFFATACCRRVWDMLDERGHHAVEVAEQFADGLVGQRELDCAGQLSLEASQEAYLAGLPAERMLALRAAGFACHAVRAGQVVAATVVQAVLAGPLSSQTSEPEESLRAVSAPGAYEGYIQAREQALRARHGGARATQAALLRDLCGNPFRPAAVSPDWLTSTAVALARGVYDERAFDRLPILADALQDAGCDNDELLDHLRGPGPHVRGCWGLDLILGRA